ncbi:hypothetical protein [Eikenella sp. NML01-A-086]|uniref:hypothetical protein n=1 Tax=Eikenella sp. NML01-A-086 TaxID=1795826 RepID=UPI000A9C62B0|nr:hypothetical protein [Eikenella sp. NML01-A-086]
MKAFALLLTAGLVVCTLPAAAQNAPERTAWKQMPEITFNFYRKTGTPQQAQTVREVWGNRLRPRDVAFALLTEVDTTENHYIFTMLDNSDIPGGTCLAPPNGDGTTRAQPTYSTCTMRVVQRHKASGRTTVRDLPNYCYLNLDDEPGNLARHHTEYAYDAASKTIRFRTIMYGRHTRECDRSIQLR